MKYLILYPNNIKIKKTTTLIILKNNEVAYEKIIAK